MRRTVGMEFDRVMGQPFSVRFQELSIACSGCRMGISA
jgi:hypothetical protein